MIDFQALKQQLKLLGHHLPDDQIRSILADMKVDVCERASITAIVCVCLS